MARDDVMFAVGQEIISSAAMAVQYKCSFGNPAGIPRTRCVINAAQDVTLLSLASYCKRFTPSLCCGV